MIRFRRLQTEPRRVICPAVLHTELLQQSLKEIAHAGK
jgi:hypothetical protein